MSIIYNNKIFVEQKYSLEDDFENEIYLNYKNLFGKNTVYINTKKKIESKFLENTIPDGFLFDLSDIKNPEFYIIEVELSKHDFYNHIFPQITKFFAFFKNPLSQKDLVEKIFTVINKDLELKQEFKKYLGEKEIFKFLTDLIDASQNILLILDGDKIELPEIMNTYTDTWGKFVKIIKVIKYQNKSDFLYYTYPDFENIEFVQDEKIINEEENIEIDENFHLESSNENVIEIYNKLKNDLIAFNNKILFNPQKYYISIRLDKNIAFIKIRKKKIRIVIMAEENIIKENIKKNIIHSLSQSVQTFYNGACSTVDIEKISNLDEVIELIKKII